MFFQLINNVFSVMWHIYSTVHMVTFYFEIWASWQEKLHDYKYIKHLSFTNFVAPLRQALSDLSVVTLTFISIKLVQP